MLWNAAENVILFQNFGQYPVSDYFINRWRRRYWCEKNKLTRHNLLLRSIDLRSCGSPGRNGIRYTNYCDVLNTLRPIQNGCHFADDRFKCIFLNGNIWISITISVKFVPKGPINNIPALFRIMAWCRPGDRPLSELMIIRLLTHTCVTLS